MPLGIGSTSNAWLELCHFLKIGEMFSECELTQTLKQLKLNICLTRLFI